MLIGVIIVAVILLSIYGGGRVDIDTVIPESTIDIDGAFLPDIEEEDPAPVIVAEDPRVILADETPVIPKPVSIFPRGGKYVYPAM